MNNKILSSIMILIIMSSFVYSLGYDPNEEAGSLAGRVISENRDLTDLEFKQADDLLFEKKVRGVNRRNLAEKYIEKYSDKPFTIASASGFDIVKKDDVKYLKTKYTTMSLDKLKQLSNYPNTQGFKIDSLGRLSLVDKDGEDVNAFLSENLDDLESVTVSKDGYITFKAKQGKLLKIDLEKFPGIEDPSGENLLLVNEYSVKQLSDGKKRISFENPSVFKAKIGDEQYLVSRDLGKHTNIIFEQSSDGSINNINGNNFDLRFAKEIDGQHIRRAYKIASGEFSVDSSSNENVKGHATVENKLVNGDVIKADLKGIESEFSYSANGFALNGKASFSSESGFVAESPETGEIKGHLSTEGLVINTNKNVKSAFGATVHDALGNAREVTIENYVQEISPQTYVIGCELPNAEQVSAQDGSTLYINKNTGACIGKGEKGIAIYRNIDKKSQRVGSYDGIVELGALEEVRATGNILGFVTDEFDREVIFRNYLRTSKIKHYEETYGIEDQEFLFGWLKLPKYVEKKSYVLEGVDGKLTTIQHIGEINEIRVNHNNAEPKIIKKDSEQYDSILNIIESKPTGRMN